MAKRTPPETDDHIISLLYLGCRRPEIEAKTGKSAGYIAGVKDKEENLVGEGVVEGLRRLAKELRKSKATLIDIIRYIRFRNACKSVDLEEEDIIEYLHQIAGICKKEKLAPKELLSKIESGASRLKELEQKVSEAEKAAQAAEKHREEAEGKEKYDREQRDKFHAAMTALESWGLSMDDPERLRNALLNGHRAGYDVKALVKKISEVFHLDAEKMNLEGQVDRLKKQKEEYEEKINAQALQLNASSPLLEKANELKSMGCNDAMLKAITDTIKQVASKNNLTEQAAAEKFVNDILTRYESLSGLDSAVTKRQSEKQDLEASIDSLGIAYAKHSQAITSLNIMHEKGITDGDIAMIYSLLVNQNGSGLSTLTLAVARYGNIDRAVHEREKELKELETRKLALEPKVSLLEDRKASLIEYLQWADGALKANTQSMLDTTKDGAAKISKATEVASDAISQAQTATVRNIRAIGEEAAAVTKRYANSQGVLAFEPLIRHLKGEPVGLDQVRESGLYAMSILLASLPPEADSAYSVQAAIKNLKSDPALVGSL